MPEPTRDSSLDIRGLVLVPALITLGITLLRVGGELAHWSPRFFSTAPGGGAAVVGISWLPFLFGPYFAIKLTASGHGAPSLVKVFGSAMLGIVFFIAAIFVGFLPSLHYPGKELVGYLLLALAASVVTLGWPALFRVLVAYSYAARIPVALVMLFALHGHWGTHYDVVPSMYAGSASFFVVYMQIAFLPQLVLWISFTVLAGALPGTVVTAMVFHGKTPPVAT
ncbi:MAG: hypothetical protein WAO35_16230 [Terriglobia bacterium]